MTFRWFRKHEKLFLWGAVAFTVVVFATFSGLSDLRLLIQGGDADLAGTFEVAHGGGLCRVSSTDWGRARRDLNRFGANRDEGVAEGEVWRHLMLLEDARAAGVQVADAEVDRQLASLFGRAPTAQEYRNAYSYFGFNSAREFERVVRDQLLVSRYVQLAARSARILDAEEVYQRWRTDNELFDFSAVVFDDLDPAQVEDPDPQTLRAWFDDMLPPLRDRRFEEPAHHDLALAYLPLDADPDELPMDRLAEPVEPDEAAVTQRFRAVRYSRFADLEEPDEELRAVLARELKVVALRSAARAAFDAAEERDAETFKTIMAEHGLVVLDPAGFLAPDELRALEPVGSDSLANSSAAWRPETLYVSPDFSAEPYLWVIWVQAVEAARPLAFEEAGPAILTAWKEEQHDRPAREFREALSERARALPEVAEEIAELTDETAITSRLGRHEHKVWDELLASMPGAEVLSFEAVSRGWRYQVAGDAELDRKTLDYYLRTQLSVFAQDVDGITPALFHPPTKRTVVVRVTGRSFAEREAMFADGEGMERARRLLAGTAERLWYEHVSDAAWVQAEHDLRLVVREEEVDQAGL